MEYTRTSLLSPLFDFVLRDVTQPKTRRNPMVHQIINCCPRLFLVNLRPANHGREKACSPAAVSPYDGPGNTPVQVVEQGWFFNTQRPFVGQIQLAMSFLLYFPRLSTFQNRYSTKQRGREAACCRLTRNSPLEL